MDVLVTGAFGRVGTAITDTLAGRPEYEFTYFDIADQSRSDTIQGDVGDYEAIEAATAGADAVIHLAVYPDSWSGPMDEIVHTNIVGTHNTLKACAEQDVETVIFASSHHVMGMYERELEPDIYQLDNEVMVDHRDPVRPDSRYAVSKVFGEASCRYFVENEPYPKQCYAIRFCSVRDQPHDHPYSDAERAVQNEEVERGSSGYERKVKRMKAMWHSRHDVGHMIECCLKDEDVEFDIFYGVSDNDRRWFDISHAKRRIGYEPRDTGETWDTPPDR